MHRSITSDSNEVSEFKHLVLWQQLWLRSHQGDLAEVVILHGCRRRSNDECDVGIGAHQGFSYNTLGSFDFPDYLLPASVNSGYIAICVVWVLTI